ncbi:MAG: hypothetical protein ABIR47_17080 [Candidatus Kapaibacterium sp.]
MGVRLRASGEMITNVAGILARAGFEKSHLHTERYFSIRKGGR